MEIHHYKTRNGTKYRAEITTNDAFLYVDIFENDKGQTRKRFALDEYNKARQQITDFMASLSAVRDWS